jgi:hypothetical protein
VTRRKNPPPPVDPDDYGFDVAGKDFKVTTHELMKLMGVDTITCALYMRCLKPFADRFGRVREASYYRFLQILKAIGSPGGGPRPKSPTRPQLRRALEWLQQAGLITFHLDDNMRNGALQIWVHLPSRPKTKR